METVTETIYSRCLDFECEMLFTWNAIHTKGATLLDCVWFGKIQGMTTVTITLRDEDQRFIQSAMKSGRYVTESEAMSDAIAELRAREELHQARFSELRAKVMVGIAELDRGEGAEWNVEDIKAKGRALLSSQKATA